MHYMFTQNTIWSLYNHEEHIHYHELASYSKWVGIEDIIKYEHIMKSSE